MSRNRPEEQMYIDFCREFTFRFPKELKYLFRIEHGGYKIGKKEQGIRKITSLRAGVPDYAFFKSNVDLDGLCTQIYYILEKSLGAVFNDNILTEIDQLIRQIISAPKMLWIEFKVKGNKLTAHQEEVRDILISQGHKHVTCYSAESGIEELMKYIK